MIYIILFAILLIIDQFSKYIVGQSFYLSETVSIIDGLFHITYVENRGIAFGLFQGRLNAISVIAIAVIIGICVYLFRQRRSLTVLDKLAYTCIMSGALGNMIDRLCRGYVVDMLDFRGIWTFVFNFADVWINIGVILLVLDAVFFHREKKK